MGAFLISKIFSSLKTFSQYYKAYPANSQVLQVFLDSFVTLESFYDFFQRLQRLSRILSMVSNQILLQLLKFFLEYFLPYKACLFSFQAFSDTLLCKFSCFSFLWEFGLTYNASIAIFQVFKVFVGTLLALKSLYDSFSWFIKV